MAKQLKYFLLNKIGYEKHYRILFAFAKQFNITTKQSNFDRKTIDNSF